jgi:hypothetical protein
MWFEKPESHRIAAISVDVSDLPCLLTCQPKGTGAGPYLVRAVDLPEDVKVVGVSLDEAVFPPVLRLFVQSESFEEVPAGWEPHRFMPRFIAVKLVEQAHGYAITEKTDMPRPDSADGEKGGDQ